MFTMIPFLEQARWYAGFHQKAESRYAHMAGIPLIFLAVMILLGFIHILIPNVFDIRVSGIVTVLLLIYYFRLEWRLALAVTPILLALLWIANLFSDLGPNKFSLWAFLICFVLGAGLLAIGHFLEGKRPAFLDNPWFSLASPLFLTAEVIFMTGKMSGLKTEIYGTTDLDNK